MILAVVALLLFAIDPKGCSGQGTSGISTPPTPVQEAPLSEELFEAPDPNVAAVTVTAVRDMGVIRTSSAVRMRDCGYSARYEGKSVWVFGDTFLNYVNADDCAFLCNSWTSTYDVDAGDGLSGFQDRVDQVDAPATFISLTEEEKAFNVLHAGDPCEEEPCNTQWSIWPGTIVVDEDRSLAYVFYHKVYAQQGDFNFRVVGHSIAVWNNFDDEVERLVFSYFEDYPTLFFSEERDGFGSAAVLRGRQLYVYGCELLPETEVKPCRLARVSLDDILDRKAWEFYAGNGNWTPELGVAATVFYGNDMMTVFYSEHLEQYVVVYSQPMETRVVLRTAPAPEGPWSDPVDVFVAEEAVSSTGWVYDALAHPEFSEEGGRVIYITYSRETAPITSEMRLVRVELERSQQP
jgi:hypothetical protein